MCESRLRNRCDPWRKAGPISLTETVQLCPQRRRCTPGVVTIDPESSNGRTRGFEPLNEGSNPSSGTVAIHEAGGVVSCWHAKARAVKHLGVAQSGRALGLGPRDARSNRATQTRRGKRSGDRVCATSRSRRVRSSRPAPCQRSPTGRGSTLRTCAVSVRIGPSVPRHRGGTWHTRQAENLRAARRMRVRSPPVTLINPNQGETHANP